MDIGEETNGKSNLQCPNARDVLRKLCNIQKMKYAAAMKNYLYEKYIAMWEKAYDITI